MASGNKVKPDWIAWDSARWIAGTAEMDCNTEFVFFRLCMFAYIDANPTVRGSEQRNAMRCKKTLDEYRDAIAMLVELEKVTVTSDGVFVHSTEDRLRDSVGRISSRQRGAAISRRRRELKLAGTKSADIDLIISKEFPDNQTDNQSSIQTDNTNKTDKTDSTDRQGGVGEQLELVGEMPQSDAFDHAIKVWSDMAQTEGLSLVQSRSEARRKKLMARLKELGGLEGWEAAVALVADSDFLCGRVNGKAWKANFDFLLQPQSLEKVMERAYPPYRSDGNGPNGGGSAAMRALKGIGNG